MGTLVSEQRFINYQKIFAQYVLRSDMVVKIGVEESQGPSGDFLKDVTGSNDRNITWYDIPALYETNLDSYESGRFGITKMESGLIYVSPLHVEPIFGTFRLPDNATQFQK